MSSDMQDFCELFTARDQLHIRKRDGARFDHCDKIRHDRAGHRREHGQRHALPAQVAAYDSAEPGIHASGYDRGHMAPAADMKWSKQAMAESFYMSNICPQNPNLNRGDWNDLEEKSRQWAKKYGAVYIACGPVYDHGKPKRIGNNKVAVPDAFYKVILINDSKTPQAIGFLFPNKAGHKPLKKYIVTVDSVEKRTGIDFFPALPDEVENRIEAEPAKALP